jgi:hypothetical protein
LTAALRGFIGHVAHPVRSHCDGATGGEDFRLMETARAEITPANPAKRRKKLSALCCEEQANGDEINTGLNSFRDRRRGGFALRLVICVID